jgi:hypothetical protein
VNLSFQAPGNKAKEQRNAETITQTLGITLYTEITVRGEERNNPETLDCSLCVTHDTIVAIDKIFLGVVS